MRGEQGTVVAANVKSGAFGEKVKFWRTCIWDHELGSFPVLQVHLYVISDADCYQLLKNYHLSSFELVSIKEEYS